MDGLRQDALLLNRRAAVTDGDNSARVCEHTWLHNNGGLSPFLPAGGTATQQTAGKPESRRYLDSLVGILEDQLASVSLFGGDAECDLAQCQPAESELACELGDSNRERRCPCLTAHTQLRSVL